MQIDRHLHLIGSRMDGFNLLTGDKTEQVKQITVRWCGRGHRQQLALQHQCQYLMLPSQVFGQQEQRLLFNLKAVQIDPCDIQLLHQRLGQLLRADQLAPQQDIADPTGTRLFPLQVQGLLQALWVKVTARHQEFTHPLMWLAVLGTQTQVLDQLLTIGYK
jgi:hypothetical protein